MMLPSDRDRLVSVIITVYNCARYLGEAIESVRQQTYRPLELIVVDDGSDDGSGEIAQRHQPFVRYVYQPRGGIGAARNRAVGLAQGVYFAFLDADDRFPPDRLERQMAAFDQDPTLEAVFGYVQEFLSPDLDRTAKVRLRPAAERPGTNFPGAMLIRRDAFLLVGLFSTALKIGVGLDWGARVSERHLRSLLLPWVVQERRLHGENTGIRERESRAHYAQALKAALDRRRGRRL